MADILDSIETLGDSEDDFSDDLDELGFDDEGDEGDSLALLDDDDFSFEMSKAKAQEITDAIRAAATATYVLLAQAHEGKAYKALGYETWADYVKTEFDISSSRSYQLLDLSKTVKLLEEAAPEGTVIRLTEAQARDIKRELPKITERIKEESEGEDSNSAAATVDRIVEEIRDQKRSEDIAIAEKEKGLADAEQDGYHRGLEAAADSFLDNNPEPGAAERGGDYGTPSAPGEETLSPQVRVDLFNFLNALSGLTSLPEPSEFVAVIPVSYKDEVSNQIAAAATWLNGFGNLWEERLENE